MPAQPAELARLLFDRLIRVVDLGAQGIPDELESRRLERDAKNLLKVDAWAAHQILGGIAALRWDLDDLHVHHKASLQSAHGRAHAYRNYAISLQLVGLFQEAATYMALGSEMEPENLTSLQSATQFALWAGNVKAALKFEHDLEKRDPSRSSGPGRLEVLESLRELMKQRHITQDELQAALSLAFTFLRERKCRFTNVGTMIDEEQDTAFFTIYIDRPTQEVSKLDIDLGRQFAEELPKLDSALIVQLEPAPKHIQPRVNDSQTARPS